MRMVKAAITAVGGYVPQDILTNKDLTKIVDTTEEWIATRTGILERRVMKDGNTSDMGAKILTSICEQRNMDPAEIEMVICATMTPDTLMPDTANTICFKAGAVNAFGFDINAACSGFLFALSTGAQFVQTGTYKKVVVIGVDKMSAVLDYTDRTTCIIFGDGGGGVLLEPHATYGLQDAVLCGNGSGRPYLQIKAGGSELPSSEATLAEKAHYIHQEGRYVFKNAVRNMSDAVGTLLKRNQLELDDVNWVVPHQANIRIINSVASEIGVPMEKVTVNIQRYGNTTAGTLPLCLWDYQKDFNTGDCIVFTAFGAGFTWGASLLTWAI